MHTDLFGVACYVTQRRQQLIVHLSLIAVFKVQLYNVTWKPTLIFKSNNNFFCWTVTSNKGKICVIFIDITEDINV